MVLQNTVIMDTDFEARLGNLMRAASRRQFVPSANVRLAFDQLQRDVNGYVPVATYNVATFKKPQNDKQ